MRISDWSSDVCSSDLFAISAEKAVIRGSCGRSTVSLRRNRRNRIDLAGGKAPATDPTTRRSRLLLSSTSSAVGSSALADWVKRILAPEYSTWCSSSAAVSSGEKLATVAPIDQK